jgi:hypothetical protein
MNEIITLLDGWRNPVVLYMDTDSLYIRKKHVKTLVEAGLYGNNLLQCKNDYGENGAIIDFYGLGSKIKYCDVLEKDKLGGFKIKPHMTWKGYADTKKLDKDTYERFYQGEKIEQIVYSWKRDLGFGVKVNEKDDEMYDLKTEKPMVGMIKKFNINSSKKRVQIGNYSYPIGYQGWLHDVDINKIEV